MATFQERPAALQICIKGKLGVGSLVKSASPPALMGGPALCRLLLKKVFLNRAPLLVPMNAVFLTESLK